MIEVNTILNEDVSEGLKKLPDGTVNCIVTSPPYFGLRDYGLPPTKWPSITFSLFGMPVTITEQECCLGLEKTPMDFVGHMVFIFREAKRVLRDDGTLWLNFGDSYAGSGRGLDVDGTWNTGDGTSKQGTHRNNKEQIRKVNPDSLNRSNIEAGAIGNKWVKPPQGLKQKDLIGIPWMIAFALRDDGWYLRSDVIWNKPNPMPESVTDRPTKSHEYIFLLSKSQKYYYDHVAIMQDVKMSSVDRLLQDIENQNGSDRVPGKTNGPMKARSSWNGSTFDKGKTGEMMATNGGIKKLPEGQERLGAFRDRQRGKGSRSGNKERKDRPGAPDNNSHQKGSVPWEGMKANKRSVWTITTKPFKEAHFATFPQEIPETCIKAGCPINGLVLDLFMGAGTTALVSRKLNRNFIGFELNPEYIKIAEKRLYNELGMFA